MAVAAVVGYFAVGVLLKLVVSMRLNAFVVYCGVLGVLLIAFGNSLSSGAGGGLKVVP